MTSNYHTPISEGAAANADTFNDPLGQMDEALTEALLAERDGHIIQEEGSDLPQKPRLDFAGAGVTVTDEVGKTLVTIPGGVTDHGALSGLGDDDHGAYLLKSGLREWDEQGSDPSNPAANKWKMYFKTGGLYIIDDAGAVTGPLKSGIGIENGFELIWNSATSLSVGTGIGYAENGNQIDITTMLTASSLSLSNSTWYHIYVYLSGGSPAMEVVTTAPVAWKGNAKSKTGDTSRLYVGSVKTDTGGNIYEFKHDPITNRVVYRKLLNNIAPFRVASAVTAATETAASVAAVVPVTGSLVLARLTGSADQIFYVGYGTFGTSFQLVIFAGSVTQNQIISDIPMDGSQNIYYKHAAAVGSGSSNIDIYGYTFKR